ncbi:YncE family protein [Lichenihabitans psoromatis]|uniref:YncE family protein n=1 Tax=Lichenihabitans psoromatis TaxID=2528642 RepID=UPI00103848DD|nr:beta-propeller fold lactonase family protein [Lichenihabitans psoromatis]
MRIAPALRMLLTLGLIGGSAPLRAQPLLLSANDGLQNFADGAYHMRPKPGSGTLSVFDLSVQPPRPLWQVPIDQTAVGPPTAIAAVPGGRLALIANPAVLDPVDPGKIKRTEDLQILDLAASSPGVVRLSIHHHPWNVAMSPDGRLAATANGDGTLTLLRIEGASVTILRDIPVGTPTSLDTGIAFSRDGRCLLVSRRHDDVVTIFRVADETLTVVRDITVGSNPYEIVTSPDGKLAAVSNIGRNSGDRDSVTLIDMAANPVRAIGVVSVGPTPEGLAVSPDSRWLAVNSINGSNLKPGDPFRGDHSLIQLFALSADGARLVGTTEVGPNAQGVAFTPDNSTLVVQDFATDALRFFAVGPDGLQQNHDPIPVDGGPSALAVVLLNSTP